MPRFVLAILSALPFVLLLPASAEAG